MNTDTKVFLKKRFKDYYWRHDVRAPSEVHRREFGVGTLDDKIKFRHKGFKTERELNQYLKTEAPYYISYSAAYYEFPMQPMADKVWSGADLIFDLDKPMELLNQEKLDDVKDEAVELVRFLADDFGFAKEEISLNFSGSKGYHIHVRSDEVKGLSGDARRELVDYISGTGIDIEYFIKQVEGQKGIKFERGKVKAVEGSRIGPKEASKGWAKRIYDVTEKLITSDQAELEKIDGIGRKTAEKLVSHRDQNLKFLREGRWDPIWSQLRGNIQEQIYSKAITIKDDDKQVTADTSRLIRLPDTIHGGSGLLAKRVTDVQSFNPLKDAVAFCGDPVDVRLTQDVGEFDMMGSKVGPFKTDQEENLKEYAAIYLMLKDKAEVAENR
jgi:DNA primase small subunit